MYQDNEECLMMVLPYEVIANILNRLPLHDKKNCRLTCNYWRSILDHPAIGGLQYKFCLKDDGSFGAFLNSYRSFQMVKIRDLITPLPSMSLSRNKFPEMKNLQIGQGNSAENITKVLTYAARNVELLILDKLCFENVGTFALSRTVSEFQFANLTELQILMYGFQGVTAEKAEKHSKAVGNFLTNGKAPFCKTLVLSFLSDIWQDSLVVNILIGLYIFISRHTDTLRSIDCTIIRIPGFVNLFQADEIHFPEGMLPLGLQQSIKDNLKLQSFRISSTCKFLPILALPCVNAQTLATLSVQFCGLWSNQEYGWLEAVIGQNQKTLVTLNLMVKAAFNMEWLKNCSSLKTFKLMACKVENTHVQVPSLAFIEIGLLSVLNNPSESVWITQSFKNIEKVRFASGSIGNLPIPDLQLLLSLPKLREIEFTALAPGIEETASLRAFCDSTPGLEYSESRHRESFQLWIRTIRRTL